MKEGVRGTFPARALLIGLALLPAACRAPARPLPEPPEVSRTPAWVHQPDSWRRLDAIEAWLDGNGPEARPDLLAEAHLDLAEGRLALTREGQADLSAAVLATRLGATERDFRIVLGLPEASVLDRRRAQRGIAAVAALRRQRTSSLGSLRILPRSAWHAAPPIPAQLTPHTGRYDRITVHHSTVLYHGLGKADLARVGQAVLGLQREQMQDRDFGDIGYHFLIGPRGRVFAGRDLRYRGAHSKGANNVGNIGICLLGHFDQERPTAASLKSLERLIGELSRRHHISPSRLYGHQELRATACPGRNLMAWVERYRRNAVSAQSKARVPAPSRAQ